MKLWNFVQELKSPAYKWVELSYLVSEDTIHHPLFPAMGRRDILRLPEDGAASQCYDLVSQYGTHIDPPAHFIQDGRSLDQISAKEMLFPLCVIDVSDKYQADPDYEMQPSDILLWEEKNGLIPAGAFVLMRTGWTPDKAMGADGEEHYPGWGIPALELLLDRGAEAIGHQPADTDPACNVKKNGWAAEAFWLGKDKFQIELLTNVEELPATGAILLCTFPRIKDAKGFTARCVAIFEA